MPSYKNTSDRTILGIEPGGTGELDNAEGFVGPGALEETDVGHAPAEVSDEVRYGRTITVGPALPSEDASVKPSKPSRGPVAPAE